MPESKINYNALYQSLDTTWGRSSTPMTASYSVKASILNADKMQITFQTVVNFRNNSDLLRSKKKYVDESISITNEALKHIKKNYKDLTGDVLKTKDIDSVDAIEVVGQRAAVYRRKTILEIG